MASAFIQKLIAFTITSAILLYVGYSLYSRPVDTSIVIVDIDDTSSKEVLDLVAEFNKVKVDKAIFESNLFLSLQDLSVVILPEEQGRPNPFAPIGAENNLVQNKNTPVSSRP